MVTARLKGRSRRQKTDDRMVTIRLHPGLDDDLIRWWEQQPNGDGSDLIKEALRQIYLNKTVVDLAAEVAGLRISQERMNAKIDLLARQISQGIQVTGEVQGPRIDAEQAAKRRQQILSRGW